MCKYPNGILFKWKAQHELGPKTTTNFARKNKTNNVNCLILIGLFYWIRTQWLPSMKAYHISDYTVLHIRLCVPIWSMLSSFHCQDSPQFKGHVTRQLEHFQSKNVKKIEIKIVYFACTLTHCLAAQSEDDPFYYLFVSVNDRKQQQKKNDAIPFWLSQRQQKHTICGCDFTTQTDK